MDSLSNNNNNDVLFKFNTYEEFNKERLELNYENTLKIWYSLPTSLPDINDQRVKRHTLQEQQARERKIKFFTFYGRLLKRTCLKNYIHSRGENLLRWKNMICT